MPPKLQPPVPLAAAGPLDLATFNCGHAALDDWLQRRARCNEAAGFSRVFVLARPPEVVGYYSLSAYVLERQQAPRGLRHGAPDPLPAILLGRLAVARHWHGRGVGRSLLADAIRRCLAASTTVAARLLVTHPIDPAATRFYIRHGWRELGVAERPTLILPLQEAAAALDLATRPQSSQ